MFAIRRQLIGDNGYRLTHAKITVRDNHDEVRSRTVSDGSGNYTVSGLEPGVYSVSVDAEGYLRHTYKLVIRSGKQPKKSTLRLHSITDCHDMRIDPSE